MRGMVAALAVTAALLQACAAPTPRPSVSMTTTFSGAEHDRYLVDGNGTLQGQAFLRQQGGGVVTCAGTEVLLVPATAFFKEWFRLLQGGHNPSLAGAGPQYRPIVKRGRCDAQGNFQFANLPAAPWMVVTEVDWVVPSRDRRWSGSSQGGTLMKEVVVQGAGTTQVILSNSEYVGK